MDIRYFDFIDINALFEPPLAFRNDDDLITRHVPLGHEAIGFECPEVIENSETGIPGGACHLPVFQTVRPLPDFALHVIVFVPVFCEKPG